MGCQLVSDTVPRQWPDHSGSLESASLTKKKFVATESVAGRIEGGILKISVSESLSGARGSTGEGMLRGLCS